MMAATSVFVVVVLLGALGAGVWIFTSLFATALLGLQLFHPMPVEKLLGLNIWNTLISPDLLSLPLFILMGEILFKADLTGSLLRGLAPWVERLPGKLLHTNILACTLFAAVSGSSAATTATVGRITLDELGKLGYDRRALMGSLAGAGTLGFLIPPSIIMIVYGVLADTSVLKLFVAGLLPGLAMSMLFMTYTAIFAILNPSAVPRAASTRLDRKTIIASLALMWPILLLIGAVLGSMYTGLASPTEAAALGVVASVVVCTIQGRFSWSAMRSAFLSAVRTNAMLCLIVAAAGFLSLAMGYLGIPRAVAEVVAQMQLSRYGLIVILMIVYLILGCFIDGVSMIVMTLPITLPLIAAAGFDKLWYGIFLVIAVELAQVTPPVGFNLFVIQGLTREPLGRIALYAAPYALIMVAFVALITVFPEIVLWVPSVMLQTK
jgi:C4-dicarboxylate transporter, DctM subunit